MLLDREATKEVSNFTGKSIGYVSRSNIPTINGLTEIQRDEFIKHLFSATETINKVNLGSKVVVYKITNSKLGKSDISKDPSISQSIESLKASSLSSTFLAKLATKYEIKSFLGNN